MKTLIASIVSLLCGLAIGWYIGHGRAGREKTEIVQQMVQGGESADGEHAARAVRAIELVESGKASDAVQLLSIPIAHYYSVYSDTGRGDERRARLRALIEQLAKTNQTVAVRIAEASTNHSLKTP